MKSFRVVAAVYNPVYNFIEVVNEVVRVNDTAELGQHTFHPETLEWRAAIYDTTDLNELIDFVLYEPMVEDCRPLEKTCAEATVIQRELISSAKQRLTRVTPSSKAATAALLTKSGVDAKYVAAVDEDPYEVIKRHCPFDSNVLEVKREFISMQRESIRNRSAREESVEEDRAEVLRRRLFGTAEPTRDRPSQPQRLPDQTPGERPPIVLEGKQKR